MTELIISRQDGMPYDLFKHLQNQQKKDLKNYLKGSIIWNKGTFVGNTKKITSLNTYDKNQH